MQNHLKVVGIQAHLAWENPTENLDYFAQKINQIKEEVDLIILPEMFATGFSMNPEGLAEEAGGSIVKWMQTQANNKEAALAGSLMIKEGERYYNRFYFVEPSGQITHYDKRHTFTLAGEDNVYNHGKKPVLVNYKGWQILLQVCYDLRFPVFSRNTSSYDAVIYVANWPKKRIFAWDTLLKARAIENMAYCIGVNRVGLDGNGYEYNGYSGAYDSLGKTLAFAKAKETLFTAVLSKSHLEETRKKLNFLEDRDHFQLVQDPLE